LIQKKKANKAHLPFALLQVLALGSKTFVRERERSEMDSHLLSSSSSADDDEEEMLDSLQSFQFEAQTKERDNPFS
jgi:hypothetical protein